MGGRRITRNELAYMAAVVEGQGKLRLTVTPTRATVQASVRVQSRQGPLVERLCEMTGSTVQMVAAKTLKIMDRKGCVAHCPDPHIHIEAELPDMYAWQMVGSGAAIVLHNLIPYMSGDEDTAMKVKLRKFIEQVTDATPMSGRGRAAIDRSIMRLLKLGWVIPDALLERPQLQAA